MHILLTGASRGIGAATFHALTAAGHRVAGHSTIGNDGLIAADCDLERARWLRATDDSMREPKPFDSLPGLLRARRPELYGALTEPREGLYDYERAAAND